jgi:hypothetical protein
MKIKFYPPKEGISNEDFARGLHWLYADVTCGHCGKEQSVANAGGYDGVCVRCGKRVSGV